MKHETDSEDVEGQDPVKQPAVAAGLVNHIADNEEPHSRDHVEDVANVSCHSDADSAVHLQEGSVVGRPRIVRDVVADVEQTCRKDCARACNRPRKERYAGEISFPKDERDKECDTNDQHCNEASTSPTVAKVIMDVEGKEEHYKTSSQEEGSDDFREMLVLDRDKNIWCVDLLSNSIR
jgi:hypothetical protein